MSPSGRRVLQRRKDSDVLRLDMSSKIDREGSDVCYLGSRRWLRPASCTVLGRRRCKYPGSRSQVPASRSQGSGVVRHSQPLQEAVHKRAEGAGRGKERRASFQFGKDGTLGTHQ